MDSFREFVTPQTEGLGRFFNAAKDAVRAGKDAFSNSLASSKPAPVPAQPAPQTAPQQQPSRQPTGGPAWMPAIKQQLDKAQAGGYYQEMLMRLWVGAHQPNGLGEYGISGMDQKIQEYLAGVLREKGYQIVQHQYVYDYPEGGVQAAPGNRTVDGAVSRTYRPMVQDQYGNVAIPAIVSTT